MSYSEIIRDPEQHILDETVREDIADNIAVLEDKISKWKESRIHYQGLAYTGMNLVDSILDKKVTEGSGTTEDEFKADCVAAARELNRLQGEINRLTEGWSDVAEKLSTSRAVVAQLRGLIRKALNEIGVPVPGDGYPAPVVNAYNHLTEALDGE